MRHCDHCDIDVRAELDRCPLCQAALTGEAEPSVFPRNETRRSGTMALRILAFATGVAVILAVLVGHLTGFAGRLVLLLCLALLVNYAFVRHIITHTPDFMRLVARYFLAALALTFLLFLLTGNLVITTYAIPSICLTALVFDAVLVCVFRGKFVTWHAKYVLLDVLFGLAPLVLVALGLTTWDVLAFVSAAVACVLLLALLVFMREQLVAEIRKLFSA